MEVAPSLCCILLCTMSTNQWRQTMLLFCCITLLLLQGWFFSMEKHTRFWHLQTQLENTMSKKAKSPKESVLLSFLMPLVTVKFWQHIQFNCHWLLLCCWFSGLCIACRFYPLKGLCGELILISSYHELPQISQTFYKNNLSGPPRLPWLFVKGEFCIWGVSLSQQKGER